MSHSDYVTALDEDQLESLIEHAQSRIKKLRESGWERLWTVTVNDGCCAWFDLDSYARALAYARSVIDDQLAKDVTRELLIGISKERYRPEEAAELILSTNKELSYGS